MCPSNLVKSVTINIHDSNDLNSWQPPSPLPLIATTTGMYSNVTWSQDMKNDVIRNVLNHVELNIALSNHPLSTFTVTKCLLHILIMHTSLILIYMHYKQSVS